MSTDKNKDYFHILGLDWTASDQDIKRAYRQKARQYHPDVNPTEEGHERFVEVTEAYDVLGDPAKRHAYIMERYSAKRLTAEREKRPPKTSVWDRKYKQRSYASLTILSVGGLIAGILILGSVIANAGNEYSKGQDVVETTCFSEDWLQNADGSYTLQYTAIVPGGESLYPSSREFDERSERYPEGNSFDCYYNTRFNAPQLSQYDTRSMPTLAFWGIFSVVILFFSGRFLLRSSLVNL